MRRSPVVLAAAVVYVAALLAVVLWPTPVDEGVDVQGSWPVRMLVELGLTPAQGYDVVQVGANVALFLPAGFLVMALFTRATVLRVVLGAALLSTTVELAQGLLRPERFATWSDVVANVLGATAGALLAVLVGRERRTPRTGTEGRR